ncbi:hypothetical protein LINGRAHAP2_LOCUS15431 [Linum grandiflorum]
MATTHSQIQARIVTEDSPPQGTDTAAIIGEVGIEIEGLTLTDESHEHELCVVGLLMTSRNVNLNVMQDRLAMLWRPGYSMAVEDLGNKHYLFRFNHGHDLRWLLDNRP